jgi:hypothetical protein
MWFVRSSYRFVATGTWCRVLNTPVVSDINAVLLSEWYFSVRILAHILEQCLAYFPLHVWLHFFFRSCLHEPHTDTARSIVHQQLRVRKWGWVGVSLLVWPSFLRLVLLEVPVFVSISMLWFMCVPGVRVYFYEGRGLTMGWSSASRSSAGCLIIVLDIELRLEFWHIRDDDLTFSVEWCTWRFHERVAFSLIAPFTALDSRHSAAKEQKVSNKMNVREAEFRCWCDNYNVSQDMLLKCVSSRCPPMQDKDRTRNTKFFRVGLQSVLKWDWRQDV